MKLEVIKNIMHLRAAVAYLGEEKDWWHTNFHDESATDFLQYIFPKSQNTKFICSNIATRNHIDNQVGPNYYHLFRLPMSVEELIEKELKNSQITELSSKETALEFLDKLAAHLDTDGNSGPKNIGSVEQLGPEMLQVFAAEYLKAFQNDYKVHPYLN